MEFFRIPESGFSFPSGHTLNATCLALALGFLLWNGKRQCHAKVGGSLLLVIGVSRLVLGVHYPTDVIGSMLLGTAWLSAVIVFRCGLERWRIYRAR